VSEYRLIQRRGSKVAHVVTAQPGRRSESTLCAQWAPGHSSWPIEPGQAPLCKRCEKRLNDRVTAGHADNATSEEQQ
jgi:hypothetical protein